MKTIAIDAADLTIEHLLSEAGGGEVVFLTSGGEARFAIVAVDEGDREAAALRSSPDFMAYLDACSERARRGPRKTLAEIREALDTPDDPA